MKEVIFNEINGRSEAASMLRSVKTAGVMLVKRGVVVDCG